MTFIDKQARAERAEKLAAVQGDAAEAGIHVKVPGPFYIRSKEANAELKGELVTVFAADQQYLTDFSLQDLSDRLPAVWAKLKADR